MTDTRRGADDPAINALAQGDDTLRQSSVGYNRKQGTKAPSAKHFERLEACMQEYLDDGDEFSRRQAAAILAQLVELLGIDITL